jgi:hypothetical protein
MDLNDDELRRLYRSFVMAKTPGCGAECPSPEELVAFFDPSAPTSAKLRTIDHLTSCSMCAREFEFLLELNRRQDSIFGRSPKTMASGEPGFPRPGLRQRMSPVWRLSTVLAGAILFIASLTVIIHYWERFEGARAPSFVVTLMQPNQNHPAAFPIVFKWRKFNGADSYVIEIYDETLLPIWKSPKCLSTQCALPSDIASRLLLNRPYFWMVTAFHEKAKLAESELVQFIVIRKWP